MIIENGEAALMDTLFRQLGLFWNGINFNIIEKAAEDALIRMDKILFHLSRKNKYVWSGGAEPIFSPMNSVQYSIYLYLLSKSVHEKWGGKEADAVYYLNKIMHSVDWFYAIDFPEFFYAEHPLGSVMGRAQYGNRFFFYQGCTVGGNRGRDGTLHYPVIGENVLMYSNSSILGKAQIGNNVILSAGAMVLNEDIPDNTIVFGRSPDLAIKERTCEEMADRQGYIWED